MTKILILGDSFSADWTVKYPDQIGWPNMLSKDFDVVNCSQAGVSEYKIWKQLLSQELKQYSHIIISHTSPYRIPVETNPLHKNDILHSACDFIYEDVKESNDPNLNVVIEYFEKYFDMEYARFVHQLIIDKEISYLQSFSENILHLNRFTETDLSVKNVINFNTLFKKHRGLINHFTIKGNKQMYQDIKNWIQMYPQP
jgi:lysophospholipase L1-like esterase